MTTAPTSSRTGLNPGKLAVAGILMVAVAMAGFAWWWNWQRTQRCLEFYGGDGAHLLRTAPVVELLGTNGWVDLSQAPGLIHARTALLDDASYEWTPSAFEVGENDPHKIRFANGKQELVLLVGFHTQSVHVRGRPGRVRLNPKTFAGWRQFIERHQESKGRPFLNILD